MANYARGHAQRDQLSSFTEYVQNYNDLFDAMNSTEPLYNINDSRITVMMNTTNWLDLWATECGHEGQKQTAEFMSGQLYFDTKMAV